MHRVMVPIDFSETSLNAARYVAKMLSGVADAQALLYHNSTDEHEKEDSIRYLNSIKQELIEKGVQSVEIEIETGGDLIENLDKLAQTVRATLIVMGITGRSTLAQKLIGSNTLKMIDRGICPVMIIPNDAEFSQIKNVAFASEFKDVDRTTPVALLKSVLEMFNPFLHIININNEHYISVTEEYQAEKEKIKTLFAEYEKEFYFIGMNDFFDAVDKFVKDYNIDILITIPRHHSNSRALYHAPHTKKLAYHTHVPLLAAHE
jgi:nucleotide-binding universal stress UspA family protein